MWLSQEKWIQEVWYPKLDKLYSLIRFLMHPFSYNKNEDFRCMMCRKPVLRRYLYCSKTCNQEADNVCNSI
jgi:hypothetical protein